MVKSTKLILLLLVLFSFVLGQDSLEYDNNEVKKVNGSNSKVYPLKKNDGFSKNYLHVIINTKNKTKTKRNQYAILSNSTQCNSGRKALGMAPYGPVNLFIPKGQLSENLYLCVECTEPSCDYEITLKGEEKAKLSIGDQYNYYINDYTKSMEFEFEVKSKGEKKEEKKEEESSSSSYNWRKLSSVNSFHNIWVKGGNIKEAKISDIKPYEFPHGKIFHIKYDNANSYTLSVQGEIGDYINVGSIEINDKISSPLRVNDLEVMAVITKNDENSKEICFPKEYREEITEGDVVYINGIAFTKRLKTYYRENKNGNIEEFSEKNITESNIIEGIYFEDYKTEKVYCVSFLEGDTKDKAIFSLQLSSNKHIIYSQFVYPPQYPGVIYPRFLLKNEIALFRGMKPKAGAREINFNMKALMGFPDMLFDNCTNYPNCSYNDEKLNHIKDPHHSNRMSVYSFYLKEAKEINPISQFQPLMIVKCREGPKYITKSSEYCIFETTIFTDKDRVQLKEVESISQFLLANESDLYTVDFEDEKDVQKVYLDLIVFSGDVKFKIDDTEIDKAAHKYFLANKIFYSIHTNKIKGKNKIDFSVVAQKNSFYIVLYQLVKTGENNLNIRESGVNFVESIAVGEQKANYKLVYLQNFKTDVDVPFLASFYSKNCQFNISRADDPKKPIPIKRFGEIAQVIINSTDEYYHFDKYVFNISISKQDVSLYDNKTCMMYISGLEIENKDSGSQRAISLSEGVPHSFIFSEQYYTISYAYHLSDVNSPVAIDLNLIDKSTFKVFIYYDYFLLNNFTIFRNQQIFIYPKELKDKCVNYEVCTLNIVIQMDKSANSNKLDKRVETTITQVKGLPIYIGKNVLRQDFLVGEYEKYYYLDIGKDEQGDITINYKRGSGNIYAKIVKKTESKEIPEADWRGIYKFPKNRNESLRYETYLKKIFISTEDTKDCVEGCYVLITIRASNLKITNNTDEKDKYLPHRFTIIPRIIQSNLANFADIPSVSIPMNEYIVGNIEALTGENLYYYYDTVLPFESEYLMIDWQADAPILLMNVGTTKPSIEKHDYKFNCSDHDHVVILPKDDIIKKCKSRSVGLVNPTSIRYLHVTFAVYTKKMDSLYTSVYAFKLFMPPTYKNKENKNERAAVEIIHIRSDQKVQCDPGDFRTCLFAVIFDEGDINSHLIVHPRAHNESAIITFMGDLVKADEIERNNVTYFVERMTELKGKYNSDKGRNYIYIDKVPRDQCLLFIVESNINTIIEVLSSTSNDFRVVPNPSTPQIFALQSGNKLSLNFQTTQDLLINIVCVSGEGFFQWEEEKVRKYHLFGKDDTLTLTSGTNITEDKLSSLVAESSTYNWYKSDNSGFVFYITYYPRNSEYNIDQVKPGRSTEFNYRNIKFPLHFFTPIKDKDIIVSFNFYNFYTKEKVLNMNYTGPLFKIWGNVITAEEAENARIDKDLKPGRNELTVNGTSDGPFGLIYFNHSIMESSKYDNKNNYALYFVVEMGDNKPKLDFTGASMEVTILREQTNIDLSYFTPDNVYINGKLSNNEPLDLHYFRHRLRTDPNNPYMLIEFSAISSDIKWFVSKFEFSLDNIMQLPELEQKFKNGKTTMIFKVPENIANNSLYLIVYNEKKNSTNKIKPNLANYVFKYMNGGSKDSLFKFELSDSKVDHKIENKTHVLRVKIPFEASDQESITYYVKGIYNKTMIKEEIINSIAISESKGTYLQAYNIPPDNNKRVTLNLTNVEEDLSCIKVLAKGTSNAINLYALYDIVSIGNVNCSNIDGRNEGKNKPGKNDPKPGENKNKTAQNETKPSENKNKTDQKDPTTNKTDTSKPGSKEGDNTVLKWVIIGVGGGLAFIIIILLVIVLIFNCKNKSLMDKVNQTSFVKDKLVDDDDRNILT